MNINKLEEQLGIRFHDHQLIKQAFTHSSYVNEHRKEKSADNERLEFLGDAVLELGISQFIYKKNTEMPEGEMTKLRAAIVCEPSLYRFAKELHFDNFILLGKGEEQTGGRTRPALLADVFEAFLGALYLDQGYETALQFLKTYIFPKISGGAFSHGMDFKSSLQELVQQQKDQSVVYQIADEKGPSHHREFVAHVLLNGEELCGVGSGRTKKEAEQNAAKNAMDKLLSSP